MGTYLNVGTAKFKEAINSQIYVDKTRMISYLNTVINTKQKYVCVSRPRRFGKTTTLDMLAAYYDCEEDSKDIFAEYAIAREKNGFDYINSFEVLSINMVSFFNKETIKDGVKYLEKIVTKELIRKYDTIDYLDKDNLSLVMNDIYSNNNKLFVVLIDEWDCVFRRYQEDKDGQIVYLDFLRDWLKDQPYIAFAYMTGILPIKKYGEHSALNMFDEYSMIEPMQLAEYAGFTDDEVKDICKQYSLNYEEIKNWYDGYILSGHIPLDSRDSTSNESENKFEIYSPVSVVKSALTGKLLNYWNETETAEALKQYIRRNYDGLKEDVMMLMNGGRIAIDVTTYQNDMTTFHTKDDIFTLLVHLGYLGYDNLKKEIYIPDNEVRDVFRQTTNGEEWNFLAKTLNNSQKLLEATWNHDEKTVAELIEAAHDKTGNKTYNSEAALSYAIQLAYYSAQNYYTLIQELDTGKGYADLVYIPAPEYADKPAILIELKYEKDTQTAVDQIKNQNYPAGLEHYKGNIIIVRINYDREKTNASTNFKHHSCKIEMA